MFFFSQWKYTGEQNYLEYPYQHQVKELLIEIDHLHQDHLRHEQLIDELDHVLHRKKLTYLKTRNQEREKKKIPALCDEASHVCTSAISSVPRI